MNKIKRRAIIVYLLALFLMFARVDFWWWGEIGEPLLGGWFTMPMLYQLLIWILGYALVIYTVFFVWQEEH